MRNLNLYLTGLLAAGIVVGCKKTKEDPAPPAPVADFTTSLSFTTGDTIRFVNSSTDAATYYWDLGDGTLSTAANPKHLYTQPGQYRVSLQATGPGGTNAKTQNLTITWPLPVGLTCNCKVIRTVATYPVPTRTRLPDETVVVGNYGRDGMMFKGIEYILESSQPSRRTFRTNFYSGSIFGNAWFDLATDSLTVSRRTGGLSDFNYTVMEYRCKKQ